MPEPYPGYLEFTRQAAEELDLPGADAQAARVGGLSGIDSMAITLIHDVKPHQRRGVLDAIRSRVDTIRVAARAGELALEHLESAMSDDATESEADVPAPISPPVIEQPAPPRIAPTPEGLAQVGDGEWNPSEVDGPPVAQVGDGEFQTGPMFADPDEVATKRTDAEPGDKPRVDLTAPVREDGRIDGTLAAPEFEGGDVQPAPVDAEPAPAEIGPRDDLDIAPELPGDDADSAADPRPKNRKSRGK